MQKLTGSFSLLRSVKIVVIGDLILDSYTVGKANRISPEAPVAVLEVEKITHLAGGAGNVALNLVSLGADVRLIGRLGADEGGGRLKNSLAEEGISTGSLFHQMDYQTPVKTRIIADNQQIVRIDQETISPLPQDFEEEILKRIPPLLEGAEVIALSDYGKGFLTNRILNTIIAYGKNNNIPLLVDPKGTHFEKYRGASLIKPNLKEAYAAANCDRQVSLELVVKKLFEITEADLFLITRSGEGISLFYADGTREDFPVQIKEVKDVTGAGDTVLAMLALAIGCKLDFSSAISFCNLAAGIAIERFGCARVSLSDLAKRLLEFDFIHKVFDEEHLFALQEALKGRNVTLLGISSLNGFTPAIFKAMKKLSEGDHFDLILYIRDVEPDREFVDLLTSFSHVKFIIINAESLKSLCNQIEPSVVYVLDGEELKQLSEVEELYLV